MGKKKQEFVLPPGRIVPPDVYVDVTKIPDYVRDQLARATMELILDILRQPGGREMLDAKKAELKAQEEARKAAQEAAQSAS